MNGSMRLMRKNQKNHKCEPSGEDSILTDPDDLDQLFASLVQRFVDSLTVENQVPRNGQHRKERSLTEPPEP